MNYGLILALGVCSHQPAPDASWHYDFGGYQNDMRLTSSCGMIAADAKIDRTFAVRAAYVDLGDVSFRNHYPSNENAYFAAKVGTAPFPASDGYFEGTGRARGFTLGPVFAVTKRVSVEAGAAFLYNTWHAGTWNNADGWTGTTYAGVSYSPAEHVIALLRVYANVHASQAKENPLYVGGTAGPVVQGLIGVTF